MILPEWTTWNIYLYAFLAVLVIGAGPVVYIGRQPSSYNKAHTGVVLPARLGMAILYSAPILALFFAAKDYLRNASLVQWTVIGAVSLHFVKRILESLFLHRYSRPASLSATLVVAFLYSTAAYIIGRMNETPVPAPDGWFVTGVAFFFLGSAGNFYHHKLLADLRRDSPGYFVPKGGLFEFTACPHYLFEIFTWLGFAILSRHLAVWMILLFVIAYLTALSLRALEWYRAEFPDFPKNRKAILPFIL